MPGRRHARRKCPPSDPAARLRPRSTPMRTSSPTPSRSIDTNGSAARMPRCGIDAEEACGVVAADAESRLRQVVGAEGEEFGALPRSRSAISDRARQFDHGADLVFDLAAGLLHHRLRHRVDARLHDVEFGARSRSAAPSLPAPPAGRCACRPRPRPRKSRAPASRRFPDRRSRCGSRGSRASD